MKKKILMIFIGSLFWGTVGNIHAHRAQVVQNPIDVFEKSHENKVLSLQRRTQVDMNLPITRALFYGTRNSYNSSAYTQVGSFSTNQKYTIGDQLRLGARYLELEVHWTTGKKGSKELLLCSESNYAGCKTSDRTLRQGMEEIRDWISKPNNKEEVLLVYIKDHLDGHYSETIKILKDFLGSWLYRYSGTCSTPPSAEEMPKLKDMVNANQRIFLMSDSCQVGQGEWNKYFKEHFFGGTKEVPSMQLSPEVFRNHKPSCVFPRTLYQSAMVCVADNSNVPIRPQSSFTNSDIQSMLACEVNVFGIDQFDVNFAKQPVWSWGKDEPRNAEDREHCGRIGSDGRWSTCHCDIWHQFACKERKTGNWVVTERKGRWSDGLSTCLHYSDLGRYVYAAPETPYENKKLQEVVKLKSNNAPVWINLIKKEENVWGPDGRVDVLLPPP
ncbi:hypothetical protein LEP1GSC165_0565 [Leptospira santarosai str. CBC523]|uniref:hypothetical protein n=1 Tax=Leptospira santarosai TaxID=28183 RepID=UPI0002BD6609|nr:hypothetical protein [Leptospira santarosai]EMO15071.1 hypothetical protein LEP1GSC165_0565 [Leptospira santarosai str. CBC523]